MRKNGFSRRSFLAYSGATLALSASPPLSAAPQIPVGLELYSVRDELAKDLMGTVRAVAKMGYAIVEFYAPYYSWTPEYAQQVRKLMDDLGIRCNSTHNSPGGSQPWAFTADGVQKAIDLNKIIGAKYVVMASPGRVADLDGWKKVAAQVAETSDKLKAAGLRAGYHNHGPEFTPVDGKRPVEIIAAGTPRDVMMQLDVGTCVASGSDPVAWINGNPGRINSLHLKDWGPGDGNGYRVLFGEGTSPWRGIFEAAEAVGGVEYYLIEQEGSRFSSLETAQKCLANYKTMRAAS
jgi:sugar phosphate isomerase/epimerase